MSSSTDAANVVSGGCFCGAVRYRIDPPITASVNCHCTMCRRTSAAAYVSWLVVPAQQFSFSQGKPLTLQSSAGGQRRFCGTCGTPLTCVNEAHPEYVDVTVGSLDEPNAFPPTKDYFEDTRLDWIDPLRTEPEGSGE